MTGNQEPLSLRPREAAKSLGISLRTLYTWESAGLISAVRVGTGIRKTVLFPVSSLKELLASQLTHARGGE